MISVFGSDVGPEELRELEDCLDRQWLGHGPKVEQFEQAFCERLGLPNFLFVDSGSNALYLALVLLELPRGSEVIVPTFTWVACAQAVLLAGHRPVFCDVELDTQNVSAETIRPHITERTGAIMVVHYAGRPVDMDPVLALGRPVIEDAAHAVDSQYRGRPCGSMGDVGIYSFDAVKNLTTGSGGGVTTRDPRRAERARRLRYCGVGKSGLESLQSGASAGRWWECDISEAFIRMLPSDLNAAIGLAQLRRLDSLQKRRRSLWERYQRAFESVPWVQRPLDPDAGDRHSWFTYLIRVPDRDRVARFLLGREIYSTLRFHPLHLNAIYRCKSTLPNAEALGETGLNLPIHPRLSTEDLDRVIGAVVASRETGVLARESPDAS